ncbi:MAG: SpoIID/LytB domain-containing protein [Thermodesulfobacteriota bacterium]
MNKTFYMTMCLALSTIFVGCASSGISGIEKSGDVLRILVVKGASELSMDGVKKSGRVTIKTNIEGGVSVNGKSAGLPLRFYPSGKAVMVNGKPFRGVIEVRREGNSLMVINEIHLDEYVAGIINNEISSKWHIEAIKAQAVIARTYALFQKEKRKGSLYDLTSTYMDQVYSGADKEDSAVYRAVKDTKGLVLTYDGSLANTVYHSNAGGVTEEASEVWGTGYPYLESVESEYDESGPNYSWELSLSKDRIKDALNKAGYAVFEVDSIRVEKKTDTGRVKTIIVEDADGAEFALTGEDLRKALGYATLRSTLFDVEKESSSIFRFSGKGSGHGVGLSQWGAKGMAEDGDDYKDILKHYYPGTKLKRVY